MMRAEVIPDRRLQSLLFCAVILLLAVTVACASTQAKLSMYEPHGSPSRIVAKATKLHECRLERVFITIAEEVVVLAKAPPPPVPVELRRPAPIPLQHYDSFIFFRPPPTALSMANV